MGRKAFVNDLRDAALPGRFPEISTVTSGDDDGTIRFNFKSGGQAVEDIVVDAMVSGMFRIHSKAEEKYQLLFDLAGFCYSIFPLTSV